MSFDIRHIVRKNIASLVPYSSARDEYTGRDAILLDANENPFNGPLNRYPDPLQRELKQHLSSYFGITPEKIFTGNGSDEAIDLLMRAFCEPAKDEILTIDPSYGMYEVVANINDLRVSKVLLNEDFSLNSERVLNAVTKKCKLIFLCSPNNPSANLLDVNEMWKIASGFSGIVVVDEAYIDFSGTEGMLRYLAEFPNLVILRTLSKAWGLAGIRLGMAIADEDIISVLNKIKYPYNVNSLSQQKAIEMIREEEKQKTWINTIINERARLGKALNDMHFVEKIYPSDANFLLIKMKDPGKVYEFLRDSRLIVRDRSRASLCEGCLRITIGTPEENDVLLKLCGIYDETNNSSGKSE